MNCPRCENLLLPEGGCPYCDRPRPSLGKSSLKSCFIALVIAAVGGYFGAKQLGYLSQQTGMQWDEEMTGDWVRSQQGIAQIYRIHIVDRQDRALGKSQRSYHPGDRLVANFHVRSAKPGRLQPRVLLDGQPPKGAKEHKLLDFSQGEFAQFHSCLLPVTLPEAAGAYVLRLEVEDPQSHDKAFWETDIKVQKL